MIIGTQAYSIISRLPKLPTTTVTYVSTQSTTTNQDATTWSAISIGTPHPNRIVIVAGYHGVAAAATCTVNGIPAFFRSQNTAHEFSIHAVAVPNGLTADIAVTSVASLRKAFSIYYAYPYNWYPVDSGTATANTATDANVADQKSIAGGFIIYSGGQPSTLGTFTTTWNGTSGSVTENVDAQLETAASYTTGIITSFTSSDDLGDVNLAESVSGTKRLCTAAWGPPPYGS